MSARSSLCEINHHAECEATRLLDCACHCHSFEGITSVDVHRKLFGFTLREDGQVVMLIEDDGFWHPATTFDPAWLKDLRDAAGDALRRGWKREKKCPPSK